jgi:hypothetical protein
VENNLWIAEKRARGTSGAKKWHGELWLESYTKTRNTDPAASRFSRDMKSNEVAASERFRTELAETFFLNDNDDSNSSKKSIQFAGA